MPENRKVRPFVVVAAVTPAVAVLLPAPSVAAVSALPPQCSGTAPIRCHFDVAPGNYDVTVDLGSSTRAASTALRRCRSWSSRGFASRTFP